MHVVIGIIASVLFLICVSASPVVDQKAAEDVLEGEDNFVNSLEPEQQTRWTQIRNQLYDTIVNEAIGDDGEQDQNGEAAKDVEDFITSLNPTQRGWITIIWGKANRIVSKSFGSAGRFHPRGVLSRGTCGGGCITSGQCARYSGSSNCRCSWFSCRMF
ncbi:unnamed protein product [Rotaria magnacalcarata]|uniref:Uncharacterized protein n=1 Tax=Rotaria magnacalcarata TaxID=392030 RepID=A0A816X9B1_9BILA|nr:unnamed protein product [Rotaria magnacalcarata]CAF1431648.1 unnamed protein product [Rotaria magnacalcarata]CAF2081937.1 unnamed protein product [Rotaria magnacalcarata]CAF2143388.1 unnamed protein product [Rotaria magnacalcarata]CAF2188654.1 unnamed protein product [Rotaria magnacalcarata]